MSDLTERLRAEATTEPEWTTAHKLLSEAADTIDRLTRELAEARDKALEEAAKVADMWASRTATDADHLRKLRDYARAKQLVLEAEGAQRIAAATRALKEKP